MSLGSGARFGLGFLLLGFGLLVFHFCRLGLGLGPGF